MKYVKKKIYIYMVNSGKTETVFNIKQYSVDN
jgi:hypothetical protein